MEYTRYQELLKIFVTLDYQPETPRNIANELGITRDEADEFVIALNDEMEFFFELA